MGTACSFISFNPTRQNVYRGRDLGICAKQYAFEFIADIKRSRRALRGHVQPRAPCTTPAFYHVESWWVYIIIFSFECSYRKGLADGAS